MTMTTEDSESSKKHNFLLDLELCFRPLEGEHYNNLIQPGSVSRIPLNAPSTTRCHPTNRLIVSKLGTTDFSSCKYKTTSSAPTRIARFNSPTSRGTRSPRLHPTRLTFFFTPPSPSSSSSSNPPPTS